jgi:hypothetical protein
VAELTPKTITELPELTAIPDTAAFAVSSGGSSRRTLWSTIKRAVVRRAVTDGDAFLGANFSSGQPLTLWQSNADNSEQYGLVAAKTYIGLYDAVNSTWVWRTPLMSQNLSTWQIEQGGTGATTAASARSNLEIATISTETLTNNYLDVVAVRNNAGMKFIRYSGYPKQALTSGTEYTLGTLSESYRPVYPIFVTLPMIGGNNGTLIIRSTGDVVLRPSANATVTTSINIHYAYL